MINRANQYYRAHVLAPMRKFLRGHCRSREEKINAMLWLESSWTEPHRELEVCLNMDEDHPMRFSFCTRSLVVAEQVTIEGSNIINRSSCRYESHRKSEDKEADSGVNRRAWNSPHDDHNEFWHQHIGREPATRLSRNGETALELFGYYLEWLTGEIEEGR